MFPIRDNIRARRAPVVTYALIALNVAAFVWESQASGEAAITRYAIVPARLVAAMSSGGGLTASLTESFTVFSSMFLHGDVLHLAGNLWFLWIFGDNVEDRLGRLGYLAFYLVCGVVAALSQVLAEPTSALPVIGASGAIAGVLGAYLRLYPRARVLTVVPIFVFLQFFEVRAFVFLGFWFVVQLVSSWIGGDGVAWWAHIAGFVAGVLLSFLAPRGAAIRRPADPRVGRRRR